MDDAAARAKTVACLSALAEGVHPVTGEVFPADCPWHSPEIIRALYGAIRLLDVPQADAPRRPPPRPREGAPANAGKVWSEAEDRELLAAFDAGRSLRDIAASHQRTFAGIEARLEKLGRLGPEDRTTSRRVPPRNGRAPGPS